MRAKGKQVGLCCQQEALRPTPSVSPSENAGLFLTGPHPGGDPGCWGL